MVWSNDESRDANGSSELQSIPDASQTILFPTALKKLFNHCKALFSSFLRLNLSCCQQPFFFSFHDPLMRFRRLFNTIVHRSVAQRVCYLIGWYCIFHRSLFNGHDVRNVSSNDETISFINDDGFRKQRFAYLEFSIKMTPGPVMSRGSLSLETIRVWNTCVFRGCSKK